MIRSVLSFTSYQADNRSTAIGAKVAAPAAELSVQCRKRTLTRSVSRQRRVFIKLIKIVILYSTYARSAHSLPVTDSTAFKKLKQGKREREKEKEKHRENERVREKKKETNLKIKRETRKKEEEQEIDKEKEYRDEKGKERERAIQKERDKRKRARGQILYLEIKRTLRITSGLND